MLKFQFTADNSGPNIDSGTGCIGSTMADYDVVLVTSFKQFDALRKMIEQDRDMAVQRAIAHGRGVMDEAMRKLEEGFKSKGL
jgi:hypothetical protein